MAYYSGSEIAGLAKKPNPSDGSYRAVAELLSQVNIQQGYEKLYLIYRDGDKVPRYLEDGREFPLSAYRPVKSILDKIYTGKSVGSYANDLVTREDQRQVAVACLPLYGSGRTVLAVLVAECDPGDTGYHLVGPVNLYYVGGGRRGQCCFFAPHPLGNAQVPARQDRPRGTLSGSGAGNP